MISIFNKICSPNVPGNRFLFLTEMLNIQTVTITGEEVTDIVMTSGTFFNQIEAEQDKIARQEIKEGIRAISYDHRIEFNLIKPRLETNIFTDSLVAASPCGIVSIVVDGNNKSWLVGWNYTEAQERGLKLTEYNFSATKLGEANYITYLLSRKNECADLPLSDTLNTYVLDELMENESPVQIDFSSLETILYPGEGEISYPGEGGIIYP